MTKHFAVLVEDDPEQAEVSHRVLEDAGFDVLVFPAAAPALDRIRTAGFSADLFVLDRRLPVNPGEPDTDEVGDELLAEVRATFPDARVVVFTGYASIPHLQTVLSGNGQIPTPTGAMIDRISVLEKHQSIELRDMVSSYRTVLQHLDDIEIVSVPLGTDVDGQSSRVLRRVALEYGATAMTVSALGGGLSSSRVWSCELRDAENVVGSVIVKDVKKPNQLGGIAGLLPSSMAMSTLGTLSGLMDGRYANVMQAAGAGSQDLMSMLEGQPDRAIELLSPVAEALRAIPSTPTTVNLEDLVGAFITYEDLSITLSSLGLPPPSRTMQISLERGWRHGDLHPANILIVGDHAALIDFDSECVGGACIDIVALLISTLVHPDSPIRGQNWPDEDDITTAFGTSDFGRGHRCAAWFTGLHQIRVESALGQREFWAMVLAYTARQLKYSDVQDDPETRGRVIALVSRAHSELERS